MLDVAQLVEHQVVALKVTGSNPVVQPTQKTTYWTVDLEAAIG